ncbi:MAG: 2,4-dihydroxyhept-2-ene-1,7-dioic acid aldolase [Planctomycetes bacterium]|nr:2,4-dihydroxyhept-2-ene-1,7-dioic acid aldolase [Planctomycetota bacterium]
MRNSLKKRLAEGKVAVGAQLRFGCPAIAEQFGLAGFDWLLLDSEHAPQTPEGIQSQLQGIGCTAATPIVRAAKNDPDLIKLYLDMGAMGIVVPFIETADEAERGARACRYPPRGTRGWGPHRAAGYGLKAAAYTKEADRETVYIPIIESARAVKNIRAILSVEGVDSFLVGPVDLSISLGMPFEYECPKFQKAIRTVLEAAQDAGKPAGTGVAGPVFEPGSVQDCVQKGFRLLLAGGDEPILAAGCQRVLDNVRNAAKTPR